MVRASSLLFKGSVWAGEELLALGASTSLKTMLVEGAEVFTSGETRMLGSESKALVNWVRNDGSIYGNNQTLGESARLVSKILRVASDVVNKSFVSEDSVLQGWKPPYPQGVSLRQITLGDEAHFLRFFSGDNQFGSFLVRAKEVAGIINNPEQIKSYLGLKSVPTSVVDVYVPAGTTLNVGRIGAQPSFGLMENSGFQYQLISRLPPENFQNIRPIFQSSEAYVYAYHQ